jgi:hypothetical protein
MIFWDMTRREEANLLQAHYYVLRASESKRRSARFALRPYATAAPNHRNKKESPAVRLPGFLSFAATRHAGGGARDLRSTHRAFRGGGIMAQPPCRRCGISHAAITS